MSGTRSGREVASVVGRKEGVWRAWERRGLPCRRGGLPLPVREHPSPLVDDGGVLCPQCALNSWGLIFLLDTPACDRDDKGDV